MVKGFRKLTEVVMQMVPPTRYVQKDILPGNCWYSQRNCDY